MKSLHLYPVLAKAPTFSPTLSRGDCQRSLAEFQQLLKFDPVAQLVEQRTFDSEKAHRRVWRCWSTLLLAQRLRGGRREVAPSCFAMFVARVGTIRAQPNLTHVPRGNLALKTGSEFDREPGNPRRGRAISLIPSAALLCC